MSIEQDIALILLKEKAVFLRPNEPFTWTSGIKSPIYCDNRLLISKVDSREFIVKAFIESIASLKPDIIAGTATAGIPWGAWIAQEMRLPFVYVRSGEKAHGRKNSIEGSVQEGQKAILIEDLISTGKSSIEAAQKLQSSGVSVIKVMSIFTYDFKQAAHAFSAAKLEHSSLSNFQILAKVAYDNEMLNELALQQVLDWRESVTFPTSTEVQK